MLLVSIKILFTLVFFVQSHKNLNLMAFLQVEVRKQRTAFPPNFVHSLDGSHMMMTAVACRDAGLHFAGSFSSKQ